MRLSNEDIARFVEIYQQRFCKNISPQEAEEFGQNLVHLIGMVYRPIKQEEADQPKAAP